MCGRTSCTLDPRAGAKLIKDKRTGKDVETKFSDDDLDKYKPRYNLGPCQYSYVISFLPLRLRGDVISFLIYAAIIQAHSDS